MGRLHADDNLLLFQVGNAKKQKSLHALGLVPAKDMDIATLHQQPDGTSPCPFTGSAGRLRRKADEALGMLLSFLLWHSLANLPTASRMFQTLMQSCMRLEILFHHPSTDARACRQQVAAL